MSPLENRLALIHRVIVPDDQFPREYAILVTDRRSIFLRQGKTRNSWVLRKEMKFGTALVTDVTPETLQDYKSSKLEELAADRDNLTIPHSAIISLAMVGDPAKPSRRDFFVRMVMKRQKEIFQVYNLEIKYRSANGETKIKFYAVPLGAYLKPRRQVQTREAILRDYAMDLFNIYRTVLPEGIVSGRS